MLKVTTFLIAVLAVTFWADAQEANAVSQNAVDAKFFPNGSLDELHKLDGKKSSTDRRIARDWNVINGLVPAGWHISNAPGAKNLMIEMVKHPDTDHNYYMRTSGRGQIHQYTKSPVTKAKVSFKLKGNGSVFIILSHYVKKDGKVVKRYKSIVHPYEVNSDEWKNYSFDFDSGEEEQYLTWSLVTTKGTVCLDDVMIIPQK